MLVFPETLREKEGLRLAQVLRQGGEKRLRGVLAAEKPATAVQEAELLSLVLDEFEAKPRDHRRGERPSTKLQQSGQKDLPMLTLSRGITLQRDQDSQGHLIRLRGEGLTTDLIDSVMVELQNLLEKS